MRLMEPLAGAVAVLNLLHATGHRAESLESP
eukprot:SAG31_NODE_14081_length_828_cov_1.063100_2_plen_30_part_01